MRAVIAGFWVALLIGCASLTRDTSDSLLGVWHLQDYGSGPYEFSQLAFLKDGRKCVVGVKIGDSYAIFDGYINTWDVENDTLVTTFGISSTSLRIGRVMHDEIRKIDDKSLELWMTTPPGNRLEIHSKLPDVDPERICELALRIINSKNVGVDE